MSQTKSKRPSLAQQLEALRTHCARIESDLVGHQEINRRLAEKVINLQKELAAATAAPARGQARQSFGDKARRYCAQHGVRSVSRDVLMAWQG